MFDQLNCHSINSFDNLIIKNRIRTRINRIRLGNLGDCKTLRRGIHELRISFGPGYRIYFTKNTNTEILILCAGEKKTQKKDIKSAIAYWEEYKEK